MSGVSVPWSGSDEDQRFEFCVLASVEGANVAALCRRLGISRKTGYKWLARFKEEGRQGLGDRSRVPGSSPTRTATEMERLVCSVREVHPAWGGRKIRGMLVRQGVDDVPAESTITGILRRNGLIGPPVKRQQQQWKRFTAAAPNDMWQMDFKGWFPTGDGRCEPFDVLDDHSRFSLCLDAFGDTKTGTVKGMLTGTFLEYGLPNTILCDNGMPWANNQPGSRWTGLGVWLLDLGIQLSHTAIRHPQTIGKDERFHRTLTDEVLSRHDVWESRAAVQQAFDWWQTIYNYQRPHDSLGGDVPADRYTPSINPMPKVIDPPTYPDGTHTLKVDSTARIKISNISYRIGKAFIGRRVALHPTNTPNIIDIYYRHQPIRTLQLQQ